MGTPNPTILSPDPTKTLETNILLQKMEQMEQANHARLMTALNDQGQALTTMFETKIGTLNTNVSELKNQNKGLIEQVRKLEKKTKREPPTNTEELLTYVTNEMSQINDGIQEMDGDYVDTWVNVTNWYKVTKDLKESFTKALQGDEPDESVMGIAALLPSLKKALGGDSKRSGTSKSKCSKCGRIGHKKDDCYAKTTKDGKKIKSKKKGKKAESDTDSDSD